MAGDDMEIRKALSCELAVPDDMPPTFCLLYTSDAADEEDSGDLGGPRIHKKKKKKHTYKLV